MKDILKKHLLTILCIVSIVAMFLPFMSAAVKMEVLGSSSEASQSMTGFSAAQEGFLGYLLLVGPVVLIAMNYIKQLEKYKGLLAIVVPAVCFIVCIIVMIQAKGYTVKAMGYGGDGSFGVEVKFSPGFGSILALLSYIGEAVVGAVTYHDFNLKNISFDKDSLERLKQEGKQMMQSVQGSISQAAQAVSDSVQSAARTEPSAGQVDGAGLVRTEAKPAPKKAVNLNRTEEILAMIEKLSKMKDSGILTEEEFTEKKHQLLSEI